MEFIIRPYQPGDLPALNEICLRTGDNGTDASHLYRNPNLLGQFFAAPYAVLEPDLCFVLTRQDTPCGYMLGTRDSAAFYARCERDWLPTLRVRHPLPEASDHSLDAEIIRLFHEGYTVDRDLAEYPAHLHIDLLPEAQGQGYGRRLIGTFLDRLRVLSVPAVHLQVSKRNIRAIGFYERVGFHKIKEYTGSFVYGLQLE
jgi:ribosomal protein S18 acetylase RimI-like enzyme